MLLVLLCALTSPLAQEAPQDLAALLSSATEAADALAFEEALQLGERVLDELLPALSAASPETDLDTLAGAGTLGGKLYWLNAHEEARALLTRALGGWRSAGRLEHPAALHVRGLIASLDHDVSGAHAHWQLEVERREALQEPADLDLARARANLASTYFQLGDLSAALPLLQQVLASRERVLGPLDERVIQDRANVAVVLHSLGDLAGARRLQEQVLQAFEASLPADHTQLASARNNLANTLNRLGEADEALALLEAALEARDDALPPVHPERLRLQQSIATSLFNLGRPDEAAAIQRLVVDGKAQLLPEGHRDLLRARSAFAAMLNGTTRHREALPHHEHAVEVLLRQARDDDPVVVRARANLAACLFALGRYDEAREHQEAVLAVREANLPPDHPDVLGALNNLAATLGAMNDPEGALRIEQQLLAARERIHGDDHPWTLLARANLATTLGHLGAHDAALPLDEAVVEARARLLAPDDPDLLQARRNLATTRYYLGHTEEAIASFQDILEIQSAIYERDHPEYLMTLGSLAAMLYDTGELQAADPLEAEVVAAYEQLFAPDHVARLEAQAGQLMLLSRLGRRDDLTPRLDALLDGMMTRLTNLSHVSAREARTTARIERHQRLWIALQAAEQRVQTMPGWSGGFDLVETIRHVSLAVPMAGTAVGATEAELAAWRAEDVALRARLGDVISGRDLMGPDEMTQAVEELTRARDAVQQQIREHTSAGGGTLTAIRAQDLAATLASDAAAVGFLEYERAVLNEETRSFERHRAVLAHVVLPDSPPVRLELGDADSIERLVHDWHGSIGRSIGRAPDRGVTQDDAIAGGKGERLVGDALRRRLLDPVLAIAGDARTLHVCLDAELHLVPLDALPLGGEGVGDRLGDRYTIVNEVSFARVIAPPAEVAGPPSLLALGGADFGARATTVVGPGQDHQGGLDSRAGADRQFSSLPATRVEVRDVAEAFLRMHDADAHVLTGADATRDALWKQLPGRRFVHLATHGWFDPGGALGELSEESASDALRPGALHRTVADLAPMTLCGLALAGANGTPEDPLGTQGRLTAEALAGMDLASCELAVLSACETNVGLHRAGQGMASLRASLHEAGARTSVTSLWTVGDEATRRLMGRFYSGLWDDGLGPADALWEAKRALREAGSPIRDWAGWVLTGDPE
jgi:CHAT domain-containing protein/tetratricopeptide (TPR) repeat protein